MAASKPMKGQHIDDGGTITAFIAGTDILFACSAGHWWTVKADSSGTTPPTTETTAPKKELQALIKKFGEEPLLFMKAK